MASPFIIVYVFHFKNYKITTNNQLKLNLFLKLFAKNSEHKQN